MKDAVRSILKNVDWITPAIVIAVFILAWSFVRITFGPVTHSWSATYCHPKGCDVDEARVSGRIRQNFLVQTCPETFQVADKKVVVGIVLVPIYQDYNLVPGTCQIKVSNSTH
jgi:hypothetical protein